MKKRKKRKLKAKSQNLLKIREIKKTIRGKYTLTLICKKCKKDFRIRINNPDLYTLEVRKNWHCLFCKEKRRVKS